MKFWWLILSVVWLMGCAEEQSAMAPFDVQVAAQQVECVGITKQRCFEVRFAEDEPWQLLFDYIEGFEFEPGFIYTLRVEQQAEKQDDPNRSQLAWKLVKIINKVAVKK